MSFFVQISLKVIFQDLLSSFPLKFLSLRSELQRKIEFETLRIKGTCPS
jgi:hypothetical protein